MLDLKSDMTCVDSPIIYEKKTIFSERLPLLSISAYIVKNWDLER